MVGRDGAEDTEVMEAMEGREGKEVVDSPLDKEDIEAVADRGGRPRPLKIGRASCRERVF